ncbi:MAG: L-threonylcarbamoyladenylate synthase [Eubacterium sp.]
MDTIIKKIVPDNIDMDIINQAAQIIREGGIVAFPTETVYGLGGDAMNKDAAALIYAAKGRPSDNPLIAHIADISSLHTLVSEIPREAEILMDKYWPGPLTLIFNKRQEVPFETTGGLDTVAVRMPCHPVAEALIRIAGTPIAAPSANLSGRPSPTVGEHVIDDLNGRVDMIIDGGSVGIGLESTIVDVTCTPPMILRPGYITQEMLNELLGRIDLDETITKGPQDNLKPKAPGMKYRHYAPKAEFTMFEGEMPNVIEAIIRHTRDRLLNGADVGIITTDEYLLAFEQTFAGEIADKRVIVSSLGQADNLEEVAGNLYAVLRNFDKTNVKYIYGETFLRDNLGQAIMNRLSKAAGYHIERT